MERIFLNAGALLVSAVAEWLQAQMRVTPGGVQSLSHILVIVPTRQAGRRLRLALAEQSGEKGCLPPLVRLPTQLIVPAREPAAPVATPAETVGLLSRFLLGLELNDYPNLFPEKGHPREKTFPWALGVARQLTDLWGILQENALAMQDVAERIEALLRGEDLDVEVARWKDLAKLETLFFEELGRRNRTPIPAARQQAVAEPLFPEGIERIVLPALSDAQPALYPVLEKLGERAALTVLIHAPQSEDAKFDRWGRPDPEKWLGKNAPILPLTDSQIFLSANSAGQASLAAEAFAAVAKDEERPSLGMVDDTLFNELQSAFSMRGLQLHNPASYPLTASSLGRLIVQLEQLRRQPRFPLLAAFLREADVMHWIETRLAPIPGFAYAAVLRTLDDLQNKHLPQTLDSARQFCEQERDNDTSAPQWSHLLAALDEIRTLLDPQGRPHLDHLTDMLQTLFAARTLREQTPGDRELAAAAEATLAVFESLRSGLLMEILDEPQRALLFETLLVSATYQLEPETSDALLTEGWLELPWSPAREVVITGFNEGAVPDAVVGHAFLPDRLRQGLGLTGNERRTARDTALLQALVTSRPPGAVRFFLERASSQNDVRKPSRLLFLCDEKALTTRAKKLFHDTENAIASHPRSLPDGWRLDLPLPSSPPEKLSATAFKTYLACPFTFYLKHVLSMEACDDRMGELDAMAFGTLCHNALESFGKSKWKDSDDAGEIAGFLKAEISTIVRRQFGETFSTVLRLQEYAACQRMEFFAARQAQLRAEGWKIVALEKRLAMQEQGVPINGRADRLDYNPACDTWRILDYKTWDRPGANGGLDKFLSSKKTDLDSARQRGLAPFDFAGKPRVWIDLQLPLYLLMTQAGNVLPSGARVECGYFVVAETLEDTICTAWDLAPFRDDAVAAMRWVIGRMQAGIYWPPTPRDEWARDYASLFLETPGQSINRDWIADQEARLAKNGGSP
ncbi:MAG: PD-(D/E)XK nuclease family protein [Kiritimatiellae bacterium]|nr:PD-(D/E)XK nuclease family protein [Kiritimatiellia bacterium]